MMNIPIIIYHLGYREYVPLCMKQALKYNDNVTYERGCNNSHRLNDDTILVFSMARPGVNFLFLCPKGFYSMVSVKGFFKTNAKNIMDM